MEKEEAHPVGKSNRKASNSSRSKIPVANQGQRKGPETHISMTPEMLRRLATQRIGK